MNKNDDFDAEMKADETMGLYRRLWDKQESPKSLDRKILENYRKTFQSKQGKTTFFRRWFRKFLFTPKPSGTWTINWAIPTVLVAGIALGALGIMLGPLIEHMSPYPSIEHMSPYPSLGKTTGFKGQQTGKVPDPELQKLSREEWLESIAELVVQGRVTEAQRLLEVFKKRYPDYEKALEN